MQLKKQNIFNKGNRNNDLDSDVNSQGSVKDLVFKFNSNIEKVKNEEEKREQKKSASPFGRFTKQDDAERASLGDAFVKKANARIARALDKSAPQGRGQSLGVNRVESDGRMSIADQYLNSVNKNQDGDSNHERSFISNSSAKKSNIFNKARAMKAGQKFSVHSEQQIGPANHFFKQTGEGIVNRDDGGNLISANQFAMNLISTKPANSKKARKSLKQKKEKTDKGNEESGGAPAEDNSISFQAEQNNAAVNDTGMLSDLDAVRSPPRSPEPRGRGGDDQLVFANLAEKRGHVIKRQNKADQRQASEDDRAKSSSRYNTVKVVKKLGALAKRETSAVSRHSSKLTADIIVIKPMNKEEEKEEKKSNQDANDGIKFATEVAPRAAVTSRQNVAHDSIGQRVADLDLQHRSNDREFQLEYATQSARKLSKQDFTGAPRKNSPQPKTKTYDEAEVPNFAKNNTTVKSTSKQDKIDQSTFHDKTRDDEGTERTDIIDNSHGAVNRSGMFLEDHIAEPILHNSSRQSLRSKRSAGRSDRGNNRRSGRNSQRSGPSASNMYAASSNANFVEYVVGGDTLLPKRVRSRKSDLPYSNSCGQSQGSINDARMSSDAAEIIQLQKQIGGARNDESDQGEQIMQEEKQNASQQARDEARASFSDASGGQSGDLKYETEGEKSCNAEEDTPTDYDEDDEALDEIERRIAEQDQVLNLFVDNKAAKTSQSQRDQSALINTSATPYYGQQSDGAHRLANYLDSSNTKSNNQLDQLHHELELEELQKAEQHRLEQAVEQAAQGQDHSQDETIPSNMLSNEMRQTGTKSQLASFNDMSNIQRHHNESSHVDISGIMQQNIDAIEAATTSPAQAARLQAQRQKQASVISVVTRSHTPLVDVSDITNPSALRLNYLEKHGGNQSEQSIDIQNNQREEQLKKELELLELELELQMNEAEMGSEEDVDVSYTANQLRASEMHQHVNNNAESERHTRKMATSDVMLSGASKEWMEVPQKPIVPVNIDEQEVLCSNCYETIPMNAVDLHSTTCFKDEPSFRHSQVYDGKRTSVTIDEEQENQQQTEELNERIFKLIQTFLRKLDSQVYLDQIYNSQGNDDGFGDASNAAVSTFSTKDVQHGRNKPPTYGNKDKSPITTKQNYASLRSASALAEERSLIHEVVQHAHLALQGHLHELQNAAEQLEQLEQEHDLNQKFEFNNHMVFNRIVQVVNIKLEVMQDWQRRAYPDEEVPYTSKQLRMIEQSMRIEDLNFANLNMLPAGPLSNSSKRSGNNSTRNQSHQRLHSQEQQLHEFIQASKVQAMNQRKKKATIFTQKRGGNALGDGTENWLLSDMGSDNVSIGGDSNTSHNFNQPKFQAQVALINKKNNKQ